MLTGTWLERLKLVAGLRFLLAAVPTLLLALLAEFFRFLLLVVVCRAGSALARPAKTNRGNAKNIKHTDRDRVWDRRRVCVRQRRRASTWTSASRFFISRVWTPGWAPDSSLEGGKKLLLFVSLYVFITGKYPTFIISPQKYNIFQFSIFNFQCFNVSMFNVQC